MGCLPDCALRAADSPLLLVLLGGVALLVGAAWLLVRRGGGGGGSERPGVDASSVRGDASSSGRGAAVASQSDPPDLVRITHPFIRRAAEAALRKGGPAGRAVVRHGDALFFSFAHIADPAERQQAIDLVRRIETEDAADIDMAEALRVVRRIFA